MYALDFDKNVYRCVYFEYLLNIVKSLSYVLKDKILLNIRKIQGGEFNEQ